jgi:glycosyltransferase involved in cell wall biosynthesis
MQTSLRVLFRKCRSAVWHARHRYGQLRQRRQLSRRLRPGKTWLRQIQQSPPEVLVGANFVDVGGTRMHMHSIVQYSSLKVALAPDESVMKAMSPTEFTQHFGAAFQALDPTRFRVVHSHVFPFFIEWARKAKQKFGTRWIHTHHNWYYPEFGRNGLEPWQEQFNEWFLVAAAEADVCLCVSRSQQRFLREQFGLNCSHLPNGVDIQACRRGDAGRWQRTTGIAPGFVLFVGRNDPVKDPEFFVRVANAMPDLRFVIAGQGISRHVIQHEWQLQIPPNLEVIGELTHAQVQDAITACSSLVLCSKREGLPTLVLEGLVQGRPVVISEEQGCLEATGDGKYGFVYSPGNLSDCVAAVERSLKDTQIANAAQSFAVENYGWNSILKKLDDIYLGRKNC